MKLKFKLLEVNVLSSNFRAPSLSRQFPQRGPLLAGLFLFENQFIPWIHGRKDFICNYLCYKLL